MSRGWSVWIGVAATALLVSATVSGCGDGERAGGGKTRLYYIAADEVAWDFAPSGKSQLTGKPFDAEAKVFVARGPERIGKTYVKALYREYTDSSFSTLKPRPPEWRHLGLLGPLIHAEVGDTIRIVFRNNLKVPASMHPHNVFYKKDSEGAPYTDKTSRQAGDIVPPGGRHVYIWKVPERAGPGPGEESSILSMYHSHVNESKDTNSGLIGPMIITRAGMARADGSPKDVDRELVTMFTVVDENDSWYLDQNIKRFAGSPGSVDPEDDGFVESNLMHSINGYVFGNLPMPTVRIGEHVRWYLLGMGTEVDLHTPHWHGNTVVSEGQQGDVVDLLPADMITADMVPDNPGIWLFHCHVNDHIKAGMLARYRVTE